MSKRRKAVTKVKAPRVTAIQHCQNPECGGFVSWRLRADARYCSAACRQAAYRARHRKLRSVRQVQAHWAAIREHRIAGQAKRRHREYLECLQRVDEAPADFFRGLKPAGQAAGIAKAAAGDPQMQIIVEAARAAGVLKTHHRKDPIP
jgi:hypothetical protein